MKDNDPNEAIKAIGEIAKASERVRVKFSGLPNERLRESLENLGRISERLSTPSIEPPAIVNIPPQISRGLYPH